MIGALSVSVIPARALAVVAAIGILRAKTAANVGRSVTQASSRGQASQSGCRLIRAGRKDGGTGTKVRGRRAPPTPPSPSLRVPPLRQGKGVFRQTSLPVTPFPQS